MRKGNVKILLLLLFVLAGLAFVFLMSIQSESQANKTTQNIVQQDLQLAQMQETEEMKEGEKPSKEEMYAKKLEEFKKMAEELDQKDMSKFKMQTSNAFMDLASLIGFLQPSNRVEIDLIKERAKNLLTLDKEEDLVQGLKDTFKSSYDALRSYEKNKLQAKIDAADKNAIDAQYLNKVQKMLQNIKEGIKKIDKKNYMAQTKALFMEFHKVLENISKKEMAITEQRKISQAEEVEE